MKEKKGRLYKFYGKLTIRNKLLISCLPFVVLGYFLIFYSTTVIMFDQMKQMVYDQTEQNVMEKKKLVNTLLDNYNQATIKFLYYTDEVQEYLNTRQSVLSVEEQEKLTDMISYQIGSLITNNQDALMNVCIYNKFNELYINNAIYYNTIEQTNDFAEILKEAAEEMGYCANMKEYKLNPDNYKGSIADFSMIIRVALTTKTTTPDLYEIMKLLGTDRIKERIALIQA